MIKNGRQAGTTLSMIRDDHKYRYQFAINKARELGVKTIVDIGCGTGYGSYMMAKAGFKVTAYEIDQSAIDFGEMHYKHENLTRIQADIGILDVMGFDMLTGFEIIEHTNLAPSLLKRAGATHFVGSVPNELTIPFAQNKHKQHYRHYSPDEFKQELIESGWKPTIYSQAGKHGSDADITDKLTGRTLIAYANRSI